MFPAFPFCTFCTANDIEYTERNRNRIFGCTRVFESKKLGFLERRPLRRFLKLFSVKGVAGVGVRFALQFRTRDDSSSARGNSECMATNIVCYNIHSIRITPPFRLSPNAPHYFCQSWKFSIPRYSRMNFSSHRERDRARIAYFISPVGRVSQIRGRETSNVQQMGIYLTGINIGENSGYLPRRKSLYISNPLDE